MSRTSSVLSVTIALGALAREAALAAQRCRAPPVVPLLGLVLGLERLHKLRHCRRGYLRCETWRHVVLLVEINLAKEDHIFAAHDVHTLGNIAIAVAEKDTLDCALQNKVRWSANKMTHQTGRTNAGCR